MMAHRVKRREVRCSEHRLMERKKEQALRRNEEFESRRFHLRKPSKERVILDRDEDLNASNAQNGAMSDLACALEKCKDALSSGVLASVAINAFTLLDDIVFRIKPLLNLQDVKLIIDVLKSGLRTDSIEINCSCMRILSRILGNPCFTREVLSTGIVNILNEPIIATKAHLHEKIILVWCSIIRSDIECRNYILGFNIVSHLLGIFKANFPQIVVQAASVSLATLSFSHKWSPLPYEIFCSITEGLVEILLHNTSDQIVEYNVVSALARLQIGDAAITEFLILSLCIPKVLTFLKDPMDDVELSVTILYLLCGIAESCVEGHTQHLIDLEILPRCVNLLKASYRRLQIYAYRLVGDIIATNSKQLQCVIDEPGLMKTLIAAVNSDSFYEQFEAAQAILNSTLVATQVQIIDLIDYGLMDALYSLVNSNDVNIIEMGLEIIEELLEFPILKSNFMNIRETFEENNVLDKIESLIYHDNQQIADMATFIIDHFEATSKETPEDQDCEMVELHEYEF